MRVTGCHPLATARPAAIPAVGFQDRQASIQLHSLACMPGGESQPGHVPRHSSMSRHFRTFNIKLVDQGAAVSIQRDTRRAGYGRRLGRPLEAESTSTSLHLCFKEQRQRFPKIGTPRHLCLPTCALRRPSIIVWPFIDIPEHNSPPLVALSCVKRTVHGHWLAPRCGQRRR
jgi:hypothetical protein